MDEHGEDAADTIDVLPSASRPQLLLQLLDTVARGVRSTKGLEEALGVDPRTVRHYVQAGGWLRLLCGTTDPQLTPEGLALVYAGTSRQERYLRAVREQPFVAALLDATKGRPTLDDLRRAVAAQERNLAPSTVDRKASALRGLLAPCLEAGPPPTGPAEQLALPLGQGRLALETASPARLAGTSFSPDLVRLLLVALLDHGELTLGQVRGLLDNAGANEAPLGGYVEHLIARGDAVRVDERLVVTPQATRRVDVVASTAGVILSDAGWRAHLAAQRLPNAAPAGRWRPWDRRLFGHDLAPTTLERDLGRVLRDRTLAGHPVTEGPSSFAPVGGGKPFLSVWAQTGLVVALPPMLAQAWEGVAGINRHLENARHRSDAVAPPNIGSRPAVVHGGLLPPGAPPPKVVPDARTLRQRLVAGSPYVAMTVALLLGHRAEASRLEVRLDAGDVVVRRQRSRVGPLLDVLDAFGRSRSWVVSRRPGDGGLPGTRLISLLEHLGLVVIAGDRVVLDDAFFARVRSEDERVLLGSDLGALTDAIVAFLDAGGAVR